MNKRHLSENFCSVYILERFLLSWHFFFLRFPRFTLCSNALEVSLSSSPKRRKVRDVRQFSIKTRWRLLGTSSRGRSPLVSQTTGSIYLALMKFRGHRRAAFKRSYRPTTSNSKVDGWIRQCRSPHSEVNLQAAPLPPTVGSYTNDRIRSWQTAPRSTTHRSSFISCNRRSLQKRQVTFAAAGEHYRRRWR